jgi:PTS system nitrogen regulatory IIA component
VKGTNSVEVSFIRLKKPLPFDAIDGEPVDLLFALAVPETCGEDHLKLLSQVAELFSDPELLQELRAAESSGRLLKLLSSSRH